MILKDPNTLFFDEKSQSLSDKRSRKWFSFPIKNFIKPLLEKRNSLKKQILVETNNVLKGELDAKQTNIKLMVNTLYGVLASQFFKIGNVVLADNITGKARAGVWMIAKALNGNQTITDGTCYGLKEVFFLKDEGKKPSLSTLSCLKKLESHRNVTKKQFRRFKLERYFFKL